MILSLEYKKIKRTGFLPAFICGGTAAAALPILNTAVRSDVYTGLDAPALSILLDANWQMTALLNVLLIAIGTCILYYTEFSNNAIQRMHTLPLMESRLFFGTYLLLC